MLLFVAVKSESGIIYIGQGLKKMRKPAQIESWLTPEELWSWLKEAPTVEAYQKRLAGLVNLSRTFPCPGSRQNAGGFETGRLALAGAI